MKVVIGMGIEARLNGLRGEEALLQSATLFDVQFSSF
jgi:hypothetical protein